MIAGKKGVAGRQWTSHPKFDGATAASWQRSGKDPPPPEVEIEEAESDPWDPEQRIG